MKNQNRWLYGCLILLSSMASRPMNAQTYCSGSSCELVCNGGFETLVTPTGPNQLTNATDWYVASRTPDAFSTASSIGSLVNVPCNAAGYQYPHSGNAYAGLLTNGYLNGGNLFGWCEGMTTTFSDNLITGKMYEVSFYVSAGDLNAWYNKNLRVDIDGNNVYIVPVSLLNDYINWVLVSFPYCATGGESVLSIYSVNDHTFIPSTPHTTAGCTYTAATDGGTYIYIDDVSVKEAKFNVSHITGCLNTPVTLTASPLCNITTGNFSYAWNYGDGSAPVTSGTTTAHTYTAFGTYTGTLTVSTPGCSGTYTFNVNIPPISVGVTSNTNTICNGINNFTATPNPSGTYTYSWALLNTATGTLIPTSSYTITGGTTNMPSINFANLNEHLSVCVTITSSVTGCNASACLFMPSCCPTPTTVIKHANKTFTTNTTISTAQSYFGGTLTVNTGVTVTLLVTNARLDPNTKFIVNGTGKLIIGNSYVHAGCNYMWDGIYALSTSSVTIRNSIVEDAKRVLIDSLGEPILTMTNNYINKNYLGLVLKAAKTATSSVTVKNNLFTCSNVSIPAGPNYNPATIANLANAGTLGAFTSALMLPPYNTLQSVCGVYMENASHTGQTNSAISIGATTNGTENVFDKMQVGAYVLFSSALYQNNVFQSMKHSIAPGGTLISGANPAIFVFGTFNIAGPYHTTVGGASTASKNTFTDNDYGVFSIGKTGLLLENNRFETQTNGVAVSGNSNNSNVQVAHNKFINNKIGVNLDQNTLIDATVSENWMDNTSAQGTYADNFAIRTTEAVLATNPLSYPKYTVYNNYINGYYNGIKADLIYKAIIRDNEVHSRADNTAGNFQSGIQIAAGNDNEVYNNLLDYPSGTSANWWQYNIFTAGSTVPKIHCNSTSYGGVGIIANGLNYTAAGNGFYGNSMSNHDYAFWINANGEIGNQYYLNGGTNYSADNTWTNCFNQTFSSTGSNTMANAVFYTRASAPYNITSAGGGGFLLLGTNSSTGFTGACYAGISTPTLNLRVAGTRPTTLMQKAHEIASNAVLFDETHPGLKQTSRRQLFSHLALQQVDLSTDKELNAFAHAARHSSLGDFFRVDSLINTGLANLLHSADAINGSMVSANLAEATQQTFNTHYISFIKNGSKAGAADVSAFESIARLCPSENGDAVYQARSVLFNITHKTYVNPCEYNNAREASGLQHAAAVADASLKLYPNPSNGKFVIETNSDAAYGIEVYNMLGEKLYEKNMEPKQEIDLQFLPTATYLVKISSRGMMLKTQRISIIH